MPHTTARAAPPAPSPGAPRPRVRRAALGAIGLGTATIAVAYLSAFLPPAWAAIGPWLMAIGLPVLMVALMTLGAVRDDRPAAALRWPFVAVCLLLAGCFVAALVLPPDRVGDPLVLGVPRRAAVILYGVGMLPMAVLPLLYAFTFSGLTLSDDDLARVRAARRAPALPDDAAPGRDG